jgi:hypothetical protein
VELLVDSLLLTLGGGNGGFDIGFDIGGNGCFVNVAVGGDEVGSDGGETGEVTFIPLWFKPVVKFVFGGSLTLYIFFLTDRVFLGLFICCVREPGCVRGPGCVTVTGVTLRCMPGFLFNNL